MQSFVGVEKRVGGIYKQYKTINNLDPVSSYII